MTRKAKKLVSQPLALAFILVLFALAMTATPALAAPETPVAKPATAVTGNSAVLHGELNPNAPGEPGEYYFRLKQSSVACFPESSEFPEEPYAHSLGNEKEAVEVEATNLEPNQDYSFCLESLPSSLISTPVTFKTLASAKPYVYKGTTTATEVGAFSATLTAKVNPEDQETTFAFELATNEAFTENVQTVPGSGPLPPQEYFTQQIPASLSTGNLLEPGTTYYFRILATNPTGTTQGPIELLTTQPPADPAVISESVSSQNSFEPKLEARINPNYEPTSYYFEYSTSKTAVQKGEGTIVKGAPPAPDLPAVFEEEPGQLAGPVGITGLQPGTTYYYRVVANDKTSEEEGFPDNGFVHSFQADGAPALTTNPTGAPTRTSASVSGTVNVHGLATTYHFAYVPAAQYEAGAANPYARGKETYDTKLTHLNEENHEVSLEDYEPHPVGLNLEELQPETTYVYALVASNELGVTYGAPQTFTTQPKTPALALTGAASGVSQSSATLAGYVDTRGLQTSIQFELGTAPGAGALHSATVVPGSEAGTGEEVQATFGGDLQPGTTYYYRVLASNEDGSQAGAVLSFTTPGFPAQFPSAALPAVVPYTPIAQLNAKEAKEGKAINPGKPGKKKGKKKRRKQEKSKAHGRGAKPKKRKGK